MKKIILILALLLPALLSNAQVKISDLPSITTLSKNSDVMPIVHSGTTYKTLVSNLMKYVDSTKFATQFYVSQNAISSITFSSPLTGGTITSTGTVGINNAAADGSTKGAASFTAADFNASSGLISIDYTNAQTASGSLKGFLSSSDWTAFNGKAAAFTELDDAPGTYSGAAFQFPMVNSGATGLVFANIFSSTNQVVVECATTANITLSGLQTIDGIAGVDGVTRVLVWQQTTATDNGVYVQASGSWTRATDADASGELNDELVFVSTGTTYKGRYFSQLTESPSIGVDDIVYSANTIGGSGQSGNFWSLTTNSAPANAKFGTHNNRAVPIYTNNTYRGQFTSGGVFNWGASNQFAISTSGVVTSGTWNGTALITTYGGTGLTSYTQGDIPYYNTGTTLTALAKGSAHQYLSSDGTSNNPSWEAVNLADGVSGNLPVTNLNSGTSASSSTFWRGDGTWATPSSSAALTSTYIGFGDGSNALTGSANLTYASSALTFIRTSIGVTSADGIILSNTTAAAAGAQQFSPRLRFTGQGWKTNATAASQTVDFIQELVPIQGSANPSANLYWSSQINGGGYSPRMTLASGGFLGIGENLPTYALHIKTSVAGAGICVNNTTHGSNIASHQLFQSNGVTCGFIGAFDNGTAAQNGIFIHAGDASGSTQSTIYLSPKGGTLLSQGGITTNNPNVVDALFASGVSAVMDGTNMKCVRQSSTNTHGTEINMILKNGSGSFKEYAKFNGFIVDNTASSEEGGLAFYTMAAGTTTEISRVVKQGFLLGGTSTAASATKTLHLFNGTAPSGSITDGALLYSADNSAGNASLFSRTEAGITGVVGVIETKTDTGDPTGYEGRMVINTFDNTFKIYADGGWRTLASGW